MAPEAQSTLLLWKNWTSMGWLYLGPHREQYVCVAGSSATSLHGLRCPPQPHRAWHHGSNPWNQSIDFVPFGRYDGTTLHAWLIRLPRKTRDSCSVSRMYSASAFVSLKREGGMRGAASTWPQQPVLVLTSSKMHDFSVQPLP